MLGVGGLPPPAAPALVLRRATATTAFFTVSLNDQTHKESLSLLPVSLPSYSPLSHGRTGLCLFAKRGGKGSNFGGIEVEKEADFEGDDGFDDDLFDDEFDEEDDDVDEDNDLPVPFQRWDAWMKRKPRGFGEGKVYDTSIEDKLLEEIEQSRKAQFDNVKMLKNKPNVVIAKKELNKELKASKGVASGIRVRINNLPKKRNVHRDLKSAFEGVPGIIDISPVVSGNKKTRDPVCKGFGYVDFESLDHANRFVQMFSSQTITFGKIEKHVKCDILEQLGTGCEDSAHKENESSSELRFTSSDNDDYDGSDEELDEEDIFDSFELLSASEQEDTDSTNLKSISDSALSIEEANTKAVKKKSAPRNKPGTPKRPKLNVPGSAKRLKVREQAKLAEVFSRYGSNDALASKQT